MGIASAAMLAQDIPKIIEPLTGWLGAGLLSAVLFWLLYIFLPQKDKQMRQLMADWQLERAQFFNEVKAMVAAAEAMYRNEVSRDRDLFLEKSATIIYEIGRFRKEMEKALASVCKFDSETKGNPPPEP
jgi:hypothetical protein